MAVPLELKPVVRQAGALGNSREFREEYRAVGHHVGGEEPRAHANSLLPFITPFERSGMDDIDVFSIPGFREPVNCFTHLFAACVFSVLGYYLVRRGRGSWIRMASLAVMVITSVFLLSMSGVYHLLAPGAGRHIMRQLDIAGVFALIAGTMTPIHAILFRGFGRWSSLSLMWSAAALGITLRTIFEATLPFGVGTAIFLVLGWGGLIAGLVLWRRYGFSFVRPLVWGGVAYTLGAIVLSLNWPTIIPGVVGAHEVWHLAVLTGLGLHWKFVFQIADGLHPTQWQPGCDRGAVEQCQKDGEHRADAVPTAGRQLLGNGRSCVE